MLTPENCGDTMRMCYNFLVYTRFGALRMPNSRKKKRFISVYLIFSNLATAIYLVKFNNGDTKIMFEICSELTPKTEERGQCRCFGVYCYLQNSHIFLLFLLLTLNK